MKIVLVTFGSRGDVQPMLALSLALKSQGHKVRLIGPPEKSAWAKQLGCPYIPLGSDVTAFIDSMPNAYSLPSAVRFVRFVRKQMEIQFQLLPKMVADADLIVGSSLAVALPAVADALRIAYRFIVFTPQMLRSSQHPFPAFIFHGCGSWFNRLTWKFARAIDLLYMDRLINRHRRQLGARPTPNSWQTLLGKRVVVASDPAIAGVPVDVNRSSFIQTGYLHLRQPPETNDALNNFLMLGSAPLYAGFGSMPKMDQIQSVEIIVAAARRVGRRVVIAKFWEGPSSYDDMSDVFFIHHFPHLDLFPHMAAVIHHGGAGTTATSAISGTPQVVVPQILDQHYWGHRVHQAGLGPKPIRRSDLNADKLATAIQEVLDSGPINNTATKIAQTIKRTDSIRAAVKEIIRPI